MAEAENLSSSSDETIMAERKSSSKKETHAFEGSHMYSSELTVQDWIDNCEALVEMLMTMTIIHELLGIWHPHEFIGTGIPSPSTRHSYECFGTRLRASSYHYENTKSRINQKPIGKNQSHVWT